MYAWHVYIILLSVEAKKTVDVLVDGMLEKWNIHSVPKSISVWQLYGLKNFDHSHTPLSTLFFEIQKHKDSKKWNSAEL